MVGQHEYEYEVRVVGHIGPAARQAFEDLRVAFTPGYTDLTGRLDQAALYGVLNRIQALGLELVEVARRGDADRPEALP